MMHGEASAAWRLFTHNWIPIGLMAVTLALCVALTGFSIRLDSLPLPFAAVAIYLGVAYYNVHAKHKRDPLVVFILGSTAQLALITLLMTPLTYIAAAADLPMQDTNLANLDQALGLDWRTYFFFVYDQHPRLIAAVCIGYAMLGWPLFGIPIALGATRQYRRLQQFTLAFALALVATAIISSLLPAIGTYQEYGINPDPDKFTAGGYLDQLHDLPLVRDGSLRALDITKLAGIITFPSFHAAGAVLFLWALWSVWWMRPLALVANIGMLLATPMGGGHYFVDVFAGMAVAVLAIVAARWIGDWITRHATRPVAPMPPATQPANESFA
jgi:PAP2 superfamily